METAPLIAALTSMLAMGLTIVLARLVRQERQRSDARVSMLMSLAAEPAHPIPATPVTPATEPLMQPPVRLEPRPRAQPAARRAAPQPVAAAAEIEIFREASFGAPAAAVPELFEPAAARSGGTLLYVFAAAVVMVALIAFSFRWAVSAPGTPTSETTQAVAGAVAQPLSLVSLGHEQHADGTLVISGVVRNPPDSTARERLFAVASLVDDAGVLIASARAPLDFTMLAAGDESPFVVRVAGAAGVARYRVGFRDAEGRSVPHVDRR